MAPIKFYNPLHYSKLSYITCNPGFPDMVLQRGFNMMEGMFPTLEILLDPVVLVPQSVWMPEDHETYREWLWDDRRVNPNYTVVW